MTFGLTPEGFVAKSAPESKTDFDDAFKGIYGTSIGSEPDGSIPASTSIGQEVAILVDSESGQWQLQQALYAAFDPDQAVTPQLQILCSLTGTIQEGAQFSSLVETCIGDAGTQLPAGRVVTVTTTGTRFVSQAVATLALVTDTWSALTSYAVNELIINGGRVWQVETAGVSSAATPPTGAVGDIVTEGTVTWRAMADSTAGVALVDFKAEVTGALAAAAGTLVNIGTPVAGWTSAYNLHAADLGRAIESEPALRKRRVQELQSSGGGPPDAIAAAILEIDEVVSCRVFQNVEDFTDSDGLPPHSVEVLIQAPAITPTTNAELALAVWRAVGAGIKTYGNLGPFTVQDAAGRDQVVYFSRPVEVPIYIALTVFYVANEWPGGAAAVEAATKSAIGTDFLEYTIGLDVRSARVAAATLEGPQEVDAAGDPVIPATAGSLAASGLLGVANGAGTDGTLPYIGTAPAPVTSTKVTVTSRQIATVDPANITVTATAATP